MDIRNNPSSPKPSHHNVADFTRPNRDAIERGTPDVEDIRERIASAKAQQLEKRIGEARDKHADRVMAARRNLRAEGTSDSGDVLDIDPAVAEIDPAAAEIDGLERDPAAEQSRVAARAQAARDKLAENARRALAAREQLADRAQDARDKLSLSDTSIRLRAAAQPSDETSRAERVAELKELYQAGRLNSAELVGRAATNLLSGE